MNYRQDGLAVGHLKDFAVSGELAERVRTEILTYASSPYVLECAAKAHEPPQIKHFSAMKAGRTVEGTQTTKNYLAQAQSPLLCEFGNELLPLVSELAGAPLQVYVALYWVTFVVPPTAQRYMSQKWHRDPYEGESKHSLKLFWYFSDVDEGAGPMEYIMGSQEPAIPEGRAATDRYLHDKHTDELAHHPRRHVCTGPRDTVYIADTTGIHRGGYCTTTPRVNATLVYVDAPNDRTPPGPE